VREGLALTHLVELARVPDPTLRARLATTALADQWTVQTLKDSVRAAKAGQWYDADLDTPGTQPPPLPAPEVKPVTPARLVTRTERMVPQVQAMAQAWAEIDPKHLTRARRDRLRHALLAAERTLAAVRARMEG
jgi:hypothetical protein